MIIRMTEGQLKARQMRQKATISANKSKGGARALGRLKQGVMNKTEATYARHLEQLKLAGEIQYFAFDSIKFRLADKTFYSPDFIVLKANGELEAHEVKGFWEDDAKVKIKVAASLHPIPFVAVYWDKQSGWKFENF